MKLFCSIAVAFALFATGCGGGGDTSQAGGQPQQPPVPSAAGTSIAELASSVKKIDDPASADLVWINETTVSIATTRSVAPGDTIIYNDKAMKLGTLVFDDVANSRKHFQVERPRLDEIYSRLELQGTFDLTTSGLSYPPNAAGTVKPLAWKLKPFDCPINSASTSSLGIKCDFTLEDDKYPLVKVPGSLEASAKWTSDGTYDLLARKGKAKIDITIKGQISLDLAASAGVGTLADDASNAVCSGSMMLTGRAKYGRYLIAAPYVPIAATGSLFVFPICIAAGANGTISGSILSMAPGVAFTVSLNDEVVSIVRVATPDAKGATSPSDAFKWSLASDGTGIATFKIGVNAELALESSLELASFAVLYEGIQVRAVGTGKIEGKAAAAMVGASETLGTLRASPQLCGTFSLGAKVQAKAYATWLGATVSIADLELGKPITEKLGTCGKSSSEVVVTSTANPGVQGTSVRTEVAVKRKPTNQDIAYEELPTGTVTFLNADTLTTLCNNVPLPESGSGLVSCGITYATTGNARIIARYSGDERYKETVSTAIVQTINSNINYNDFRFEVGDASAETPLVCYQLLGINGASPVGWAGATADYETCQRSVTPVIKCLGQGCVPGRFYVSGYSIEQALSTQVVTPGEGTCDSSPTTLIVQRADSATYPGVSWGPVQSTFGTMNPYGNAFGLYPNVGPLWFKRNVANLIFRPQSPPPYSVTCMTSAYAIKFTSRVFDTRTSDYTDVSVKTTVP